MLCINCSLLNFSCCKMLIILYQELENNLYFNKYYDLYWFLSFMHSLTDNMEYVNFINAISAMYLKK